VIQYKEKMGSTFWDLIFCLGYDKAKRKIAFINLGLPAEFKDKTQQGKITKT
jgi:hypothetical protein